MQTTKFGSTVTSRSNPPYNTHVSTAPTILVVEDDPSIAMMIRKALEHKSYVVVTASDGEAALIMCVEHRPAAMILDVNLPKLDGFTVAKRIKAVPNLKQTPIIFLTAMDRPGDMIAGIQAGAKHYLTKPFKVDDLLAKVAKLVGDPTSA